MKTPSAYRAPLRTEDFHFRRPDYSFRPMEQPKKKCGLLSCDEKIYLEWLSSNINLAWQRSGAYIPNVSPDDFAETAANSLIRSNQAQLERLQAWGMLTAADSNALLERSTNLNPERITRMLMWTIAEHLVEWTPSVNQLVIIVKQLLPFHFIQFLADHYQNQEVTFADAWRFAASNPSNPESALNKALTEAERLTIKFKLQGVTFADARHFAVHNPSNPEEALIKNKYRRPG